MIVRELLRSVFRICQVIGPGEYLDDTQEESEALAALNVLLDSWTTRQIFLYKTEIETFNLLYGKNQYFWGLGEDFNSERPQFLKNAFLRMNNIDTNIEIISESKYFSFNDKNFKSIPSSIYYNTNFPVGSIYIYPNPDSNYNITISSFKKLIEFLNVEETINLPGYYIRALKFNLALDLATEYGQDVIPSVVSLAEQSLNGLLLGNQKMNPEVSFDKIFNSSTYNF